MIIWSLCWACGEAASSAEARGWRPIPGVRRLGTDQRSIDNDWISCSVFAVTKFLTGTT